MTTRRSFANLAGIVADLTRSMRSEDRYARLLDAFRSSFPCDAIALLELDGGVLVPRAVRGFSPDTLGRRFVVTEHPRLAQVLHSRFPVRFPADSALPDPYDGLVDGPEGHLYVHDCMGVTLRIEDRPWGVLTLDALTPGRFDRFDGEMFDAFAAVASATVRAADWIRRLEQQLERHHRVNLSSSREGGSEELIGESPDILKLQREARTVAPSDLPVLILGETGVGKELVARLIHQFSGRAQEPMVQINCAALPESLAESELFGHMRGAFSGATDDRIGKFEVAHEGTLFLDEVGELPLSVQAKLLRALQSGEIQRLGCDRVRRVDVRVVAATNRDLKEEVLAGRFRIDLYHRLSVYPSWCRRCASGVATCCSSPAISSSATSAGSACAACVSGLGAPLAPQVLLARQRPRARARPIARDHTRAQRRAFPRARARAHAEASRRRGVSVA